MEKHPQHTSGNIPPADRAKIVRIIDANVNRTSEALRVMEDFARFALDSRLLSGRLKDLRHRFFLAAESCITSAERIAHRDTPGDVGTSLSTASEESRAELADVAAANAKRAQEGLRVLEEYSKLLNPKTQREKQTPAAAQFKQIRYELYAIERAFAARQNPHERLQSARLYVLVTSGLAAGRDPVETAAAAIRGGADIIQLREKTMLDGEFIALARRVCECCRTLGALFIINDRVHIAQLVDADGVHVGQDDLPAADARRLVGSGKIVGVSTHSPQQAAEAIMAGADYIGVGPVNATPTKPTTEPVGLEYVRYAAENVDIPWFAIGGIDETNAAEVSANGAGRMAVCSAVISAPDVSQAAQNIKRIITGREEM